MLSSDSSASFLAVRVGLRSKMLSMSSVHPRVLTIGDFAWLDEPAPTLPDVVKEPPVDQLLSRVDEGELSSSTMRDIERGIIEEVQCSDDYIQWPPDVCEEWRAVPGGGFVMGSEKVNGGAGEGITLPKTLFWESMGAQLGEVQPICGETVVVGCGPL